MKTKYVAKTVSKPSPRSSGGSGVSAEAVMMDEPAPAAAPVPEGAEIVAPVPAKVVKKPAPDLDAPLKKVGEINHGLAMTGSLTRLLADVRNNEVRYRWANLIPSRGLTEAEIKAHNL